MPEAKRRKMKTLFKILSITFFLNISIANAQIGLSCDQMATVSVPSLLFQNTQFKFDFPFLQILNDQDLDLKSIHFQNQPVQAFPKIYNYHNLAFFCKVEVDLEKAAKFPIKFRLGDVNYVDQLEGK